MKLQSHVFYFICFVMVVNVSPHFISRFNHYSLARFTVPMDTRGPPPYIEWLPQQEQFLIHPPFYFTFENNIISSTSERKTFQLASSYNQYPHLLKLLFYYSPTADTSASFFLFTLYTTAETSRIPKFLLHTLSSYQAYQAC